MIASEDNGLPGRLTVTGILLIHRIFRRRFSSARHLSRFSSRPFLVIRPAHLLSSGTAIPGDYIQPHEGDDQGYK